MKALPRILIATSYYDGPKFIYHKSEDNIIQGYGSEFVADKFMAQTGEPEMFRNNAVRFAVENEYDYIFFADADMSFPENTLRQLLRIFDDYKEERPYIASGVYALRRNELVCSVFKWHGTGFASETLLEESAFDWEHIYRADAAATGCLLLKVDLFSKLLNNEDNLWFKYDYVAQTPDNESEYLEKWSEDMVFARTCYHAGVKFYVDPRVICGHELRSVQLFPKDKDTFVADLGIGVEFNLKRKAV